MSSNIATWKERIAAMYPDDPESAIRAIRYDSDAQGEAMQAEIAELRARLDAAQPAILAAQKECEGWKYEAETQRASADEALRHLDLRKLHQDKDVWYWQGGSDYPESMSNSMAVVIRADQLKQLLARAERDAAQPAASAKEQFEANEGTSELDPIERLRFFCSLAMNGRDWLDVEPFFDALTAAKPAADAEPWGWGRDMHGFKSAITANEKADPEKYALARPFIAEHTIPLYTATQPAQPAAAVEPSDKERLNAIAKLLNAVIDHEDNTGEEEWYDAASLKIPAQDAELIAALDPCTLHWLLAMAIKGCRSQPAPADAGIARDAERYRWLRGEYALYMLEAFFSNYGVKPWPECEALLDSCVDAAIDADAALDAAIAKEGKS